MCFTCNNVVHMSKMIQLRNVPDDLHRKLKARAASQGQSLSDYLIAEIRAIAERPSPGEMRYRLMQRAPAKVQESAARAVRAERTAR
jgi:plasmid stability protein